MADNVLEITARLDAKFDQFVDDWEKLNRKVEPKKKALSDKFRDVGRRMDEIGSRMAAVGTRVAKGMAAVGLAAGGAFAAVIKEASDFESAFTGVRKTVDATEAEFEVLRKGIMQMATEMPRSQEELAGIMEIAGQLGIRGTENLLKFTRTMGMLADTTNIVGEQGALELSRFLNLMGEATENVDRVGSTLVALGNNFEAREGEILSIAQSLAPTIRAIRGSTEETLALAAAIAASGGEAQAATTAFQKIGLTMKDAVIAQTKEARADLERFAAVAGMTAEQFQRQFGQNSMEALIAFLTGLRRIDEQGGSTTAALDELGLADQRLIREIGKVTLNLDGLSRAVRISNEGYEKNTALTREAELRYGTLASTVGKLWNSFKNVMILVGTPILQPIVDFIQQQGIPRFQELADWVAANEENIRAWAENALAAASEKLREVVEWVTKNKDGIIEWAVKIKDWIVQYGPWAVKLTALAIVLGNILIVVGGIATAIANWPIIAVGAVAALGVALGRFWDSLKPVQAAVDLLFDTLFKIVGLIQKHPIFWAMEKLGIISPEERGQLVQENIHSEDEFVGTAGRIARGVRGQMTAELPTYGLGDLGLATGPRAPIGPVRLGGAGRGGLAGDQMNVTVNIQNGEGLTAGRVVDVMRRAKREFDRRRA